MWVVCVGFEPSLAGRYRPISFFSVRLSYDTHSIVYALAHFDMMGEHAYFVPPLQTDRFKYGMCVISNMVLDMNNIMLESYNRGELQ